MNSNSIKELQGELRSISSEMNLLLVEDDALIRTQIKKLLLKFFYNVDEAEDGVVALALYKKREYDIVLTDITMPNMNGVDLSKAIKDINKEQTLLVLSAESQVSRFVELINIGIDGFIPKPLRVEQMLEILVNKARLIDNAKMKKYYSEMLDEANEQLRLSNVALEISLLKSKYSIESQSSISQEYFTAEEFLQQYEIDEESLNEELSSLEEEFNILVLSMQSQSSGKNTQKLLEILETYIKIANGLEFFWAFGEKGEAILREFERRTDSRAVLELLLPLLTNLFDQMEETRKEIFEYKSGINLHLLLDDLLASLDNIYATLNESNS